MNCVNVGIVGLGNVGSGALTILAETAGQIELKLGFQLRVRAVCDILIDTKTLPAPLDGVIRTTNWRELVNHPEVDVVAELVGGTTVALEIIDGAIAAGKSVVTANKELLTFAFNQRANFQWYANEGCELVAAATQNNGLGLRCVTSSSTQTYDATILFKE